MLSEKVRIFTFNVGQGDCHLIQLLDENEESKYNILIDGGPVDPVNGDEEREKNGIKKAVDHLKDVIPKEDIDLLIISHYDQDHIGGLKEVIDNHTIKKAWGPPVAEDLEDLKEASRLNRFLQLSEGKEDLKSLREALTSLKEIRDILPVDIENPTEGQIFSIPADNEIIIKVFSAGMEASFTKAFALADLNERELTFWAKLVAEATTASNEESIVFRISSSEFSSLFTGDAGPETLQKVYDTYQQELPSDLLKVPHHGSESSAHEDFIAKTSPNYSVISVGEDNGHGHPSKKCLELLDKYTKLEVIRTDEEKEPGIFFESEKGSSLVRLKKTNSNKPGTRVDKVADKISKGAPLIYHSNGKVTVGEGSGRRINPAKPYFNGCN